MNYRYLLNEKYNLKIYLLFLIIAFIISMIIIGNQSISNIYQTIGYVSNNKIIFNIPINYSDTLNKMEYISINNKNYYITDLEISDILLDQNSLINYQEVMINNSNDLKDNLIVPINIYYNKEKVFIKIKKLFT